jgi:hypothetical protein
VQGASSAGSRGSAVGLVCGTTPRQLERGPSRDLNKGTKSGGRHGLHAEQDGYTAVHVPVAYDEPADPGSRMACSESDRGMAWQIMLCMLAAWRMA